MNRFKILIALVFLIGTSRTGAQESLSLSLEEARKHALEFNKTLHGSALAMEKARQELREAVANGLPQIAATADYSNSLGAVMSIRFNENLPATEIEMKPTGNFYLNVNQLLFSGNYIVGVQMARLSEELSRTNLQKTELEVATQVSEAYYLCLMARESRRIVEQNLSNLESLYTKTAAMGKVGMIEQTDVDQLQVQVMAMRNAVSAIGRQEEMALNMLRLQLGVAPTTRLTLSASLDALMNDASGAGLLTVPFDPDKSVDYRLMKQQELLAGKAVNMQRANALPSLGAFYRYTYQFIEPNFNMTPPNMVGLQLNVPLFSSGLRTAQTRQALIDLKSLRNQISLLEDQLSLQDQQLRTDLNNALEAYQNQRQSVEVSRRVYQSLKLKYEQGLISGLDLISADNNYLKAENAYLSAMLDVLNARLRMEKLYGTL
ncbi:MAG TPA: TolC family protein [Bacteroidales bacterium]|nr:TolC family protein [Bacteroidales bacterium]HRZ77748.1 TolC family protein [Bacteroidales bacterium]